MALPPDKQNRNSKRAINIMCNQFYVEKIGKRVSAGPYAMNDYDLVETAFFLRAYGSEKLPRQLMEFNYEMNRRLKRPGVSTKLLKQLSKKGDPLPADFCYISSIHDPMFRQLDQMENPVKSGGRKTRKLRKHKRKTRINK